MRQRRHLLMFALALLCLSFAACGAKQYPMQITVVNRSTYPITDLRISLISEEDWGENRLETTLEEGESAGIDLGEYTEEQLNAGFHLQFYGEDGQPVNPDYDPSSPTFFENGDFLIFSPPDLSIALFLDTAYDPETYDQKIVELYAADGDGRGDVISQNGIPVLMGGALPLPICRTCSLRIMTTAPTAMRTSPRMGSSLWSTQRSKAVLFRMCRNWTII